jgi:heme-degrading monooxygenase HmoA
MHARIAVFEQRDPTALTEFRRLMEERADEWERETGAIAFYALADRSAGRWIGLTLFDSEQALHQAEPVFERMGEEVPERLRGKRMSVLVHQVLVHEVVDGAGAARISHLKGAMAAHKDTFLHAAERVLPELRGMDGWKGFIACGNDATGETMTFTLWASMDAVERSEKHADAMRQSVAQEAQQKIASVDRCEIVFVHDRAPRLANV